MSKTNSKMFLEIKTLRMHVTGKRNYRKVGENFSLQVLGKARNSETQPGFESSVVTYSNIRTATGHLRMSQPCLTRGLGGPLW